MKANYRLSPKQKKELLKTGRTEPWTRTIYGEPASKSNSRQLTRIKGVSRIIKSEKALSYSRDFLRQCPVLDPLFEVDVCVEMDVYYATQRPDLDVTLILDLLQGRVYRNDRQARRQILDHFVDRDNPRTVFRVYPRDPIAAVPQ